MKAFRHRTALMRVAGHYGYCNGHVYTHIPAHGPAFLVFGAGAVNAAPGRRLLRTTTLLRCASCEVRDAKTPTPSNPSSTLNDNTSPADSQSASLTASSSSPHPPPAADHRALAAALDLFSITPYSPGTPLLHADGSHMFLRLQQFLRAQYGAFGFREVVSPTLYRRSLWERSGHWANYKDDMFQVRGGDSKGEEHISEQGGNAGKEETKSDRDTAADEEDGSAYGLKPMNCPGHCLLFKSRTRSWRDLPIRYADFSPLHRNEISGALSGLTRVRRFHQDDGHVFCRPDQVGHEIQKTLHFVKLVYGAFGLGSYKLVLSTRPERYMGEAPQWDAAEAQLRQALDATGTGWELNEGDGAFYGPKIDIILKDSDGKEHQTATVQLDFQLPQRFELEYDSSAGGTERPVMIHRAVLGSLERFMALLIEHFKGRWPFWLSPRQLAIITVNDEPETLRHAQRIQEELNGFVSDDSEPHLQPLNKEDFKIAADTRPVPVSAKVAQAKADRYNLIAVVGRKEIEDGSVAVDFSGQPQGEQVLQLPEFQSQLRPGKAPNLRLTRWSPQGLKDVLQGMTRNFL